MTTRRHIGTMTTLAWLWGLAAVLPCARGAEEDARASDGALRADEVVVLANRLSDDSLRVARHYTRRRGIPERNLFTFDYAEFGELEPMDQNPAWYPYERFCAQVVEPLEEFLVEHGLKDKVLCLVPVSGTPKR